jgi:hypothetical protein
MSGSNLPEQRPGRTAFPAEQDDWSGSRSKTPAKRTRPGQLAEPEWIMIGASVDAGKRIYASRDLPDAFFGITEVNWSPENKITAVLKMMLVVTEPSYPECLARIQEIWSNWDANGNTEAARRLREERDRVAALPQGKGWTDLGETGGVRMLAGPAGTDPDYDAIVARALPPGKVMPTCGDPECERPEHAALDAEPGSGQAGG